MKHRLKQTGCLVLLSTLLTLSACTGAGQGTQASTQGGTQATSTNILSPGTNPSSNPGPPPQFTKPSTAPANTSANGGQSVTYEVLETVPASLAASVDAMKKDRGYFYFEKEKVLVIFMGEKNTGGYALTLRDIAVVDGTLGINVVETAPNPGDPVTQALTYPLLAIQLEDAFTDIQVQNDKGETYEELSGMEK